MLARIRVALLVSAALVVVACTTVGETPPPSGGATPGPASSPSPSGADAPTPAASPASVPSEPPPASGRIRLDLTLVAGPTCPVEQNPPDPRCAPRPVVGATIAVRDAGGAQVAQLTSDATGHASVDLAPGTYVVEARPVVGLMVSPQPMTVHLTDTASGIVTLMYDTGIR